MTDNNAISVDEAVDVMLENADKALLNLGPDNGMQPTRSARG